MPAPESNTSQPSLLRRSPRYGVERAAVLVPRSPGAAVGGPINVSVRDASQGGMLIQTPLQLSVGSMWTVRVATPEGEQSSACVVRSIRPEVADAAGASPAWLAGLMFVADGSLMRALGVPGESIPSAQQSNEQAAAPDPWTGQYDITAAGDLALDTCRGTSLRVDGSLTIGHSAVDSLLDIGGKLRAGSASFSGGTTHVLGGAVIGEVGNANRRPTAIVLGRSAGTQAMLSALPSALEQLNAEIAEKSSALRALQAKPKSSLTHQDRETLTVGEMAYADLEDLASRMKANAACITSAEANRSLLRLEVAVAIHPGVTISVGEQCLVITALIPGPVTLIADADSEIRVEAGAAGPTVDLSNYASRSVQGSPLRRAA